MPHYIVALIYIFLASGFSVLSFRQYRKREFNSAAILLVFAGFCLRFFMASDMFLHEWDERYHALVAKNLIGNWLEPKLYRQVLLQYDYREWSANYIWLHKQPLPLWCMALSMKLFGVSEITMRLPSVIVSSIAIYLTYFIGRRFFDERVGLLAAFFHAVNGLVLDVTSGRSATDHIDIFFLFFVELAVVAAILSTERKRVLFDVLTGVCIGLAVLCKWLPAFIVLPLWLMLNFDRRSIGALITGAVLLTVAGFIVFLPWQLYMYCKFPTEYANEMLHNYRHIVEVLDKQEGGLFYFFLKLHINLNEIFWPAFIWFCCFYKRENFRNRLVLLIWMLVPFIFFTVAKTKMPAYLLFVFPALFIMLADFALFLLKPVENITRMRVQQLLFAVIIVLAVRFSIERVKPFQNQSKELAWADAFKKMGKTNAEKEVYLNVKHNIEGMFYTNSIMYNYDLYQPQKDTLATKGYQLIVNQNPDL